MQLSVIILNYNVRYFLELCVLSVRKAITNFNAEIIVIDNNSTDDSCTMIKKRFPELTLIENKENVGFSKANNQAVAVANGEYICILNPDTVVGEDTFVKIFNTQKKLIHPGLLGPCLVDGTGNFLPESKRNIPSPLTSFRRLFGIKLGNVKNYYADHLNQQETGEVDVLVGAFMWCRKGDYNSVQGFDEDYFMYGEDIDLSYKFIKKGLYNYYLGSISVLHFKGESTDRNAAYVKRFYGAMRLFYQKHFKNNWILDVMVSTGIRVISVTQSMKKHSLIDHKVDKYYLITENTALQKKLMEILSAPVEIIVIDSVKDLGDTHSELIFDGDSVGFGVIIKLMTQLKNESTTFKIRPPGCDFIIGSNQSDGKGEVILF